MSCLVLAPKSQSPSHAALFEGMGQALGFELVHSVVGSDRVRTILQTSFTLADLSGNDPEVLYYLGVAHTFGKRVFMVTDALERLPYDVASSRAWVVDPSSANRDIYRALEQFLSDPYAIGPVRLFLGKFAFFGENLIARRFLAFVIDAILMLSLLGLALDLVVPVGQATIIERVAFLLHEVASGPGGITGGMAQNIAVAAAYVVIFYFPLSTWLLRGTLGQLAMGLRIVQTDYRRATFGQCAGRTVIAILAIMTCGATFLLAMRGPGYQAVHDALSGTIVVRSHGY